MQQKKYNDKRRLDGCNILEAANVVRLASHHHRPENKVQSGNDLIYLVLAPKIIIFLITHFEKRGLLIKGERTRVEKQMLGGGFRALYR